MNAYDVAELFMDSDSYSPDMTYPEMIAAAIEFDRNAEVR